MRPCSAQWYAIDFGANQSERLRWISRFLQVSREEGQGGEVGYHLKRLLFEQGGTCT